jgi:hypothetical protein
MQRRAVVITADDGATGKKRLTGNKDHGPFGPKDLTPDDGV